MNFKIEDEIYSFWDDYFKNYDQISIWELLKILAEIFQNELDFKIYENSILIRYFELQK